MMTLKEFEHFVRNRSEPDTLGPYKLIVYKWNKHASQGNGRYGEMTCTVKSEGKDIVGFCWCFPYDKPDYEYHPTFKKAHESMMKNVGGKDIYGFCIKRLGYGPLGNQDWYVAYWSYDAAGHEFDHSSCSSYHYMQPGIYGKFLGRFPDEIPFRKGDIVQIVTSPYGERRDYATLGVVIETPCTVEECWKAYASYMEDGGDEHEYFEQSLFSGADDDEYFILYGPFDRNLQNTMFCMTVIVRPPAYPVPNEARETLIGYYQEYQKYIET